MRKKTALYPKYFVLFWKSVCLHKARNQILLYVTRSLYFQNPLELQFHTAPIVSLPKFHKCL